MHSNANTSNQDALIPIHDFIKYIAAVEKAFGDKVADIVTRIRLQYYGGGIGKTKISDKELDKIYWRRAIPDARVEDIWLVGGGDAMAVQRTLSMGNVDAVAMKHLTAHADENGPLKNPPEHGDNPSPYIVMPDKSRIDVGHLFVGLDALLHPRTDDPYKAYGVSNIDLADHVADLGLAVFWMSEHVKNDRPSSDAPRPLKIAKLREYAEMSAPTEDILGDVDAFGVNQELEKPEYSHRLSLALMAYYSGVNNTSPGVSRRWLTFVRKNQLDYSRNITGGVVTSIHWYSTARKDLIDRVNRFVTLVDAGKVWASVNAKFGTPDMKTWEYTPKVVDWFLNIVAKNLKDEINRSPKELAPR